MTTFQWTIVSMPAYSMIDGQSDVVFQVNWSCQAMDGKMALNAVANGSVPVSYTAGSPFTPYADLTQEQVWGWIDPSIDRPEIEASLQAMIDEQKNPPVVTPPLPWSN
jgi:hypothetical protein